jgi:hypothetical protein
VDASELLAKLGAKQGRGRRASQGKYLYIVVVWQRIEPQVFGPYKNSQDRKYALDEMIFNGHVSPENDLILWIDSDSPHLAVGSY